MATDHCPHCQPPGCQNVSPTCGVHKVHQRRPTSSQPPLRGRHPRANRRTLIDPIPTVLSQVTAACAVFIASRTGNNRSECSRDRGQVGDRVARGADARAGRQTPERGLMDTRCCGGGPGWGRTNDQPIMRPTTDRLRECQGVSGVLNKHERLVVFVSQSVRECHGAVVKTVVKTDAPRFASAGANAGGKISQEFTWCVTACQDVSWRVRASQGVSRTTSRRRFDGLPTSKPGDTVQRMVQGSREVQQVAADAGESRVSARPAAAWRGTRNTVPSRAFAEKSAGTGCGQTPESEGAR
jgi:hypothetical protein